jgi:hypothetical protein
VTAQVAKGHLLVQVAIQSEIRRKHSNFKVHGYLQIRMCRLYRNRSVKFN